MTAVSASSSHWQFWIDRGGICTDIVAKRPDRQLVIYKLLSKNGECYTDAPVRLIREILGIQFDAPIPVDEIGVVKMGTTVATNAPLERKGSLTILAKDFGMGYESVTKTVPISLPVRLFCQK
jgi:5-oxoprolinase (ATP-hydrolysing)